MKKYVFLAFLLFLSVSLSKDYSYQGIYTNATIDKNGDADVIQEYVMDFSGSFTYMYKYFVLDTIEYVSNFEVYDKSTGEKLEVTAEKEDGNLIYRWFYSAQDESKTFILKYKMISLARARSDKVRVYYTLIERDRDMTVFYSESILSFPDKPLLNSERTNLDSELSWINETTLKITSSNIQSNVPLDFEIYFDDDVFSLEDNFDNFRYKYSLEISYFIEWLRNIVVFILVILQILFILKKWDISKRTVKEYEKEDMTLPKLKPAIAGFVVDERVNYKEITATILDLAVKGYIFIKEDKKSRFGIFEKKDIYLMNLKKKTDRLSDYEKKVLRTLFSKKDKIKINDYSNKFGEKVPEIIELIKDEGKKLGIFPKNFEKAVIKKTAVFILLPVLSIVVSITLLFVNLFLSPYIGDISIASFFFNISVCIMLFIASMIISFEIPLKTKKGTLQKKKYIELKEWMKKYPLKEARIFDEFLPFATALGVQKIWIDKMKNIADYKNKWYSGDMNYISMSYICNSISASTYSGGNGGFGGGGGGGGGGSGAG